MPTAAGARVLAEFLEGHYAKPLVAAVNGGGGGRWARDGPGL